MIRRPPRSTRTDTLFPYTTLFRSNAVGIPTKLRPSMDADAFFSDADYERAKWAFDEAFIRMAKHLSDGGTVIWPADGIGTGRALLSQRAPRIRSVQRRVGQECVSPCRSRW